MFISYVYSFTVSNKLYSIKVPGMKKKCTHTPRITSFRGRLDVFSFNFFTFSSTFITVVLRNFLVVVVVVPYLIGKD